MPARACIPVLTTVRGSTFHVPGSETRTPKPGTRNLEPGTWNLEPGTWNLEPGTWNLEPGTWNLEPGTSIIRCNHVDKDDERASQEGPQDDCGHRSRPVLWRLCVL